MVMHSDRSVLSTPSPRWKTRSAYTQMLSLGIILCRSTLLRIGPFLVSLLGLSLLGIRQEGIRSSLPVPEVPKGAGEYLPNLDRRKFMMERD